MARIAVITVLFLAAHFACSIAIAFFVEADSFPYGMQRSKGTMYLNTLQLVDRLLGLPIDLNRTHAQRPMLVNSIVCAMTLAFALVGFNMAPWRKTIDEDEPHSAK